MLPERPSASYKVAEVSRMLRATISAACSSHISYVPLLRVVYANLSLDDRPRAVNFEHVCSEIAKIIPPYDSTAPLSRVNRLAVYLAMAYHTLFFVRTGRSPFVAVSTGTMDAVQKVMYALTQTELEHGVSQMKLQAPSWLGTTLRDFLEHWALWNDPRIARAVAAILEKCENNTRAIDSPHAISSALSRLGGIRLYPWVQDSLPHDVRVKKQEDWKSFAPSSSRPNSQNSPLFTTNLAKECTLLDRNTAVSLDGSIPSSPRLHIYVPLPGQTPSILAKISSIGTRARTTKLGGNMIPLLPADVVNKYAFKHGMPRQALRLGVTINRKTLEWEAESASYDVVEIVPHKPDDAFDFSGIRRALSIVDPVLSDHELQIPSSEDNPRTENEEETQVSVIQGVLATQAQAAAGRIAAIVAQIRDIEVPFLITNHGREQISRQPGWHERLSTDAYAPVGRPLDSSLALLTVRQLTKREQIPRITYGGKPRMSLVAKVAEIVEPQLRLVSVLEDRDEKFWALRNLQQQLQDSAMFHIYRCIVLQSSSQKGGHLVSAFCLDLGINVEVFVPAHTEQLFPGDQVIGTEILELDPLQGLFIVSI